MTKITIVVKDGILDEVFCEGLETVEIELINQDHVFSAKEKIENEKRIQQLRTESTQLQQN
jgi:hypothetical protein